MLEIAYGLLIIMAVLTLAVIFIFALFYYVQSTTREMKYKVALAGISAFLLVGLGFVMMIGWAQDTRKQIREKQRKESVIMQAEDNMLEESMKLLGKHITEEERLGRTYPEAVIFVIKKLEAQITKFHDRGFAEGYEAGFKDGYKDGTTENSI